MRKTLLVLSVFAILCSLGFIFYDPNIPKKVEEYIFYEPPFQFRPKYKASDLIKAHKKILLQDGDDTFLPPNLYYLPCVLVDIKTHTPSGKTHSFTQIWSLIDGERILNLDDWVTTKGYGLIMSLDATGDEIAILDELSTKKVAHKDSLLKKLPFKQGKLENTLQKTESKGLTKTQGDYIYLNKGPFVLNSTEIPLSLPQLTNSSRFAGRFYKNFTKWDIQDLIAKISKNNTVESVQEVYVPIWQIPVVKADGHKINSYWNALSGRLVATIEEKE